MAAPAYDDIGTYAGIQGMVAELMNRNDMSSVLPALIAYAEGKLARDVRVKNLKQATFSITADGIAVPATMKSLESFALDTDQYQHPLQIVDIDHLSRVKRSAGNVSGVPGYVAIADGKFFFALEPDATYAATIAFWEKLTPLAEGVNWLSTNHADIYLCAVMVEACKWAKDLEAASVWAMTLEEGLESLSDSFRDAQFGGGALKRHSNTIGS